MTFYLVSGADVKKLHQSLSIIFKLKNLVRDFKPTDYLLLTGDPAIIGVVCCLVSDITNGKFNLLKWDRQEKKYYPIEIDVYGTGAKNDD